MDYQYAKSENSGYTMCESITTADRIHMHWKLLCNIHTYWLSYIKVGMCCISPFRELFLHRCEILFLLKEFSFQTHQLFHIW